MARWIRQHKSTSRTLCGGSLVDIFVKSEFGNFAHHQLNPISITISQLNILCRRIVFVYFITISRIYHFRSTTATAL